MDKIQDAYYLDGRPYSQLSADDKVIIDKASEKLKDQEHIILSFENRVLNLITTNTQYTFLIQSEFPQDVTGKMVYAYTSSKNPL